MESKNFWAAWKATEIKEKYRMQSQEMRRAIREVLGVRTEDDIVKTDKMHLSGEDAKRMERKRRIRSGTGKDDGSK